MAFMVLIHHGRLDITANPKVNYRLPESMPNHHPYTIDGDHRGIPHLSLNSGNMHTKICRNRHWSLSGSNDIGFLSDWKFQYDVPIISSSWESDHEIQSEKGDMIGFSGNHSSWSIRIPLWTMESKHMHPATKSCISFCYHKYTSR